MRLLAACIAIALMIAPRIARAGDAPQEDSAQLEKSIEDQATALSTDDCDTACKALASMQRATDRLCKMDPGPNCTKARSVVDSAARRVRDACPACANAFAPQPPTTPATPPQADAEEKKGESVTTRSNENAPPPESERGGCAGCDSSGGPATSDAAFFALAWLMTRARRRRDRKSLSR